MDAHEYYLLNRDRILAQRKQYRFLNKEKVRECERRSQQKNIKNLRIIKNKWFKNYHDQERKKLLSLLGDKCMRCGFNDIRALQIDHINGGGNKELKSFKSYLLMARYYIQHPEERSRIQLLCANCNWIKRYENKEDY